MRWKTVELTGWGRVRKATVEVARPERAATLAESVAERPAPAIGRRRSYGDACLNDGGAAIDVTRLDRILDFDDETGTLTAEAGLTIGDLARVFAPRGWLPPVMPGTGFATLGGAVAMDVHGKNHHHAGSFGQHVGAVTLVTPEGLRRVTRNEPLFRATAGGLGQTGPIASVELTLLRQKGDVMLVTERRADALDEFVELFERSEASYSVGWIDATADGDDLGRGILEEGETGGGLPRRARSPRSVPFDAPSFALSSPVVRAFNALYLRRVPRGGRTLVRRIEDFFFPLDRISDWNRLYGRRGFHQFQCVVPPDAVGALRDMLARIASSRLASPLAVLKRLGPGRAGMMSFPMEGWTLAVDLPARDGVEDLARGLEEVAASAGGRIYLAKDALAEAETVRAMYPERAAWAAEVARIDPERRYETDLARRLRLRDP